MPAHLRGFSCLCSAVSLTLVQPDALSSDLNCSIYSRIADLYGISTRTVERSLNQVAKVSFQNGVTSAICGENYSGSSAMSLYAPLLTPLPQLTIFLPINKQDKIY